MAKVLCIIALTGLVMGGIAVGDADAATKSFDVKKFKPWSGYAMPNGLWLPGDLDKDGRSDLVHVVRGTDYVHTWRSNGNGTFRVGTFRPWPGYAMPNGLWLPADFDGDGRSDLIHVVNQRDYVHTWRSRGDGTYAVGTFRPWGGYAMPNGRWLTGDFNRDGKTDLVHVVNNTDYVHVWLSRGNGTFAVSTFRPWQGYAMPNGRWLTADLNGDKRTDLVHVVNNTDYVHTWTSRGDGSFRVGTFRPWAGYAMPNGLWRTGDIDGDGKTDLVHVVNNTDYVHTWRSRGDGTFRVGTFRPWPGYAMPNGVWLTGDFNRDGLDDLVHAVRNTDYVHTWLSRGNGAFRVGTFSPWRGYAIPNGPWVALDFTRDGKTDIMHVVANTDYVHPWISVLPGPGEFSVDDLEISQSIQDLNHSVKLLANKQTITRAYLSAQVSSPTTVRGQLRVRRIFPSGATVTLNSLNSVVVNPAENDQVRPKREDIAKSLNFRLPATMDNRGIYSATLTKIVNASTGSTVACSNCRVSSRIGSLINNAPARVRVIGLRYTTGSPPTTYAPTTQDYQLFRSWLRRAYPTASVSYSTRVVNASNAWPFNCGQANGQVATIRSQDVANGTDARTHYYGLVADGGGFMRGCAAVPSTPNPAAIGSGPTGPGTWGWDTDGSYGDWYSGHELGHTLGRSHVGGACGAAGIDPNYPFADGQLSDNDGAFVGLDVGDPSQGIPMVAMPGVPWHDVMSYCARQWVSSYTHEGIRQRLTAENALSSGAVAGPLLGMTPPAEESEGSEVLVAAEMPSEEPSLSAAPAIERGAAGPPPTVLGNRQAPGLATPSAAAPVLPEPATAQPFVVPEPAMPGPPPIVRGAEPPTAEDRMAPSLMAPELSAEAEETLAARLAEGDFMNVIAQVNLTRNTGEITALNRVQSAVLPAAAPSDIALIRLIGTDGTVIDEIPVEVMQYSDVPPNEDVTGLVNAFVPIPAGLGRLELVVAGDVAQVRRVTANAPRLENLSVPSASAARALSGAPDEEGIRVSWEASDPDQDQPTFSVQVSGNEGTTWDTIAVGLTKPELLITPDQIEGMASLMVRVIASDGFNTSVVASETLRGPQ